MRTQRLPDKLVGTSRNPQTQFSVLSSQFSVLSSQFSVLSSQFSVLKNSITLCRRTMLFLCFYSRLWFGSGSWSDVGRLGDDKLGWSGQEAGPSLRSDDNFMDDDKIE